VVGGSVELTGVGVPFALAVSDEARSLLVSVNNSIRFCESYADVGKLIETVPGPVVAFAAGGDDLQFRSSRS
jgi:hypothetical protein